MNKIFYIIGGFTLIIAAFFVLRPKAISVETAILSRGTFEETLSSDGKLRSRTKKTIYSYGTGNIERYSPKIGDIVKKGQSLGVIESDRSTPVVSPMNGVITKLYRDSSGPIMRGDPIFEVSNLDDLEFVVEVLTPDAVRLKLKGEANILNWGGEGELKAQISQISKAGLIKTSALGVEEERTEVTLSLQKDPENLKEKFGDNYHVDVVFLISRESGVLTIPLGALFKSGDKWATYVIENNRAKSKEIQISKRNDRQAIVTSGLKEGDSVILFPGDKIREGTRIK